MTSKELQVLITNTLSTHPGFFFYFMIFMKLEEMRIIDKALFYHLNDSIVYYENELITIKLKKQRLAPIKQDAVLISNLLPQEQSSTPTPYFPTGWTIQVCAGPEHSA